MSPEKQAEQQPENQQQRTITRIESDTYIEDVPADTGDKPPDGGYGWIWYDEPQNCTSYTLSRLLSY